MLKALPRSPWTDGDYSLLEAVYRLQALSRMNGIYYELRLGRVRRISLAMEIVVAATASGSGVASIVSQLLASKPQSFVSEIWTGVALVAAIAAIVRPIYAPGDKIEALTRQHQGYQANFFALMKLAFSIRQEGKITIEHQRRYDTIFDRHVQLSTDTKAAEDESSPNRAHQRVAEARVAKELPVEKNWWPADETAEPC